MPLHSSKRQWVCRRRVRIQKKGYSYDLNGNILGLVRNDKAGAQMDNMSYSYGDLSARSNRLLRVTDSGNKATGFIDGANTDDDYSYDVNGNMVADKNKSIASISYNHLNLPTVVTKSTGDAVRYYYDATGRKLMQDVVTSAWARTKRSEYNGEMFFENDTLKFLNTEEGRAIAEGTWGPAPQLLVDPDMTNANAVYAFGPATLAAVTLNGETYIRSTANQANSASGYLSPPVTTTPMRQYTLKVKGYRTSAALAKIYVQSVGSVSGSLVEPGPVLPTAEGWIAVTFTAPSTATYIKVGVLVYSPAVGDQFFLNRMELYEYNGGQGNMVFAQNGNFTYQYHLKDHLGNVRLTFTTKDEKDISKATMETANSNTEQGQFLYYDEAVKVNSKIFDHTDVGPTWYSTRLNGSTNERFGLAKSLSVMPGDTVRAAVYAKYLDPDSSNWTVELAGFIHSLGNGAPAGTFIDGGLLGSTGGVTIPFAGALNKSNETGSAPKAYLNYIVFDRDFNFKDGGYVRVTTAARESGQKGPHEELAKELVITEPGYVYLYISNDNVSLGGGEVEVYWDDFRVEHVKSPVVQSQDYYPFGLVFNSYSRENTTADRWKFQGQEHVEDLNLGWDSFKWRNHIPEIGRFFNEDPLSEQFFYNSPYAFSENHVIAHVELEGLEKVSIQQKLSNNYDFYRVYNAQNETSEGIKFNRSLAAQDKINVMYFVYENGTGYARADGVTKLFTSMKHFRDFRASYPEIYQGLVEKEVEEAMGENKLIIIGLNRNSLTIGTFDVKGLDGAVDLNHEIVAHARSYLKKDDVNAKEDHVYYYGQTAYSVYSPDDTDVLTDPKYRATKAYSQLMELINITQKRNKRDEERAKHLDELLNRAKKTQ